MSKGYIDAEFEVVSGPLRAGDEHPIRKGWYLTDKLDRKGNALWYKPPGTISKWIRRIGIGVYLGLMGIGMLAVALYGDGG